MAKEKKYFKLYLYNNISPIETSLGKDDSAFNDVIKFRNCSVLSDECHDPFPIMAELVDNNMRDIITGMYALPLEDKRNSQSLPCVLRYYKCEEIDKSFVVKNLGLLNDSSINKYRQHLLYTLINNDTLSRSRRI